MPTAGLHRPVKLYTTPLSVHVNDVTVVSSLLSNGSAALDYKVDVFTSSSDSVELHLSLEEKQGGSVVDASLVLPGCQRSGGCVVTGAGQLVVETPRLWWPWTMNPDDPGYLYALKVCELHYYMYKLNLNKNSTPFSRVFEISSRASASCIAHASTWDHTHPLPANARS